MNLRCDDWCSSTDNVEKFVRLDDALAPLLEWPMPCGPRLGLVDPAMRPLIRGAPAASYLSPSEMVSTS